MFLPLLTLYYKPFTQNKDVLNTFDRNLIMNWDITSFNSIWFMIQRRYISLARSSILQLFYVYLQEKVAVLSYSSLSTCQLK